MVTLFFKITVKSHYICIGLKRYKNVKTRHKELIEEIINSLFLSAKGQIAFKNCLKRYNLNFHLSIFCQFFFS